MPYLDDWLICAPSHQQIVVDTESVLSVIQSLGFQVNSKKSDMNPRQETSRKRQLVDTGSPSGQGTFQANASVDRCLPDRLGSSLGGSDSERPLTKNTSMSWSSEQYTLA